MDRGPAAGNMTALEIAPLDAGIANIDEQQRHRSKPHRDIARNESPDTLRGLQHQCAAQVDAACDATRNAIGSDHVHRPPTQRIRGTEVLDEGFEALPLELEETRDTRTHERCGDGIA